MRYHEVNGVRVPQLIPFINFRSLDLRDRKTEREFLAKLKEAGVNVGDDD